MYYKVERRFNLLKVNDTFATLRRINPDGSLTFDFRYTASLSDSVRRGSMAVDVSVFTRSVKKRPIMGISSVGKIDARELMHNILTDMAAAKSAIKSAENYVLASRVSDISAAVNNETLAGLRAGISPALIPSMYRTQLQAIPAGQLINNNQPTPVLHVMDLKVSNVQAAVSASLAENTQALSHDLILRRGLDPSSIHEMPHQVIQSNHAFQGTTRPVMRVEAPESSLSRLRDSVTLHPGLATPSRAAVDVEEHKMMDVVVTRVVDDVEMTVQVTFMPPRISVESRDSTDVFVKFQLLDSRSRSAIDEVVKTLDVPTHVRVYHTPVKAPVVKQTRADIASHANLQIMQMDPGANEVHVYKKSIYVSTVDEDDYELIGIYPAQVKQRVLVQVDMPTHHATIYRVIPAYSGVKGYAYSNVVIKPRKYRPVRSLSLTAKIIDNGISIEARKLPPDVVSIQFVQRNLTVFEHEFMPVDDPQLIDDAARNTDHISVTARDVQDNNVYEFSALLYHKNGTQELSSNEIIEYVLPTPGKVDINISDPVISHDIEPNVAFNVNMSVLDTNLDAVKALMEKQGIKGYFDGDIAKQRDELKALLAYSVHRVDLNTGEREDLGVVTQSTFDDRSVRKNYAAVPLKYGHRYRYTVTAVARQPETVLDSLQKTVVDQVTKKPYVFNPAKFLHPHVLRRGVIMSPAGLKSRLSKSTLEHGTLGSTATFEVAFDDAPARIVESSASRFDKQHVIISWRIEGSIDMIDHFVIMKVVHGIRTILGTAHSSFEHGSCQWIHHLTGQDRGEIRYMILPVLSTYKHGQTVTTNALNVEGT